MSDMETKVFVIVYVSAMILVFGFAIRYLIDEFTGKNYYKKFPIAKAMDEMAKNKDENYTSDNVMKAISSIDFDKPKEQQVEQFKEQMASK